MPRPTHSNVPVALALAWAVVIGAGSEGCTSARVSPGSVDAPPATQPVNPRALGLSLRHRPAPAGVLAAERNSRIDPVSLAPCPGSCDRVQGPPAESAEATVAQATPAAAPAPVTPADALTPAEVVELQSAVRELADAVRDLTVALEVQGGSRQPLTEGEQADPTGRGIPIYHLVSSPGRPLPTGSPAPRGGAGESLPTASVPGAEEVVFWGP